MRAPPSPGWQRVAVWPRPRLGPRTVPQCTGQGQTPLPLARRKCAACKRARVRGRSSSERRRCAGREFFRATPRPRLAHAPVHVPDRSRPPSRSGPRESERTRLLTITCRGAPSASQTRRRCECRRPCTALAAACAGCCSRPACLTPSEQGKDAFLTSERPAPSAKRQLPLPVPLALPMPIRRTCASAAPTRDRRCFGDTWQPGTHRRSTRRLQLLSHTHALAAPEQGSTARHHAHAPEPHACIGCTRARQHRAPSRART